MGGWVTKTNLRLFQMDGINISITRVELYKLFWRKENIFLFALQLVIITLVVNFDNTIARRHFLLSLFQLFVAPRLFCYDYIP